MISGMIDAMEVRDVATADIKLDFLKTDYEKGGIHINMEGEMVTLLKDIEPDYYKEFIYIDSRKKMHVSRIQEGYIGNYIGITNLLDKTTQESRRNGLPEK